MQYAHQTGVRPKFVAKTVLLIINLPNLGRGPLQTTMAVIDAAKRISEAGTKLDKLARAIADQCPESSTKKDLLAYLQRIALYCHQLNITSKVGKKRGEGLGLGRGGHGRGGTDHS